MVTQAVLGQTVNRNETHSPDISSLDSKVQKVAQKQLSRIVALGYWLVYQWKKFWNVRSSDFQLSETQLTLSAHPRNDDMRSILAEKVPKNETLKIVAIGEEKEILHPWVNSVYKVNGEQLEFKDPTLNQEKIEILWIQSKDHKPIGHDNLKKAFDFLAKTNHSLVHCMAGQGRSAEVVHAHFTHRYLKQTAFQQAVDTKLEGLKEGKGYQKIRDWFHLRYENVDTKLLEAAIKTARVMEIVRPAVTIKKTKDSAKDFKFFEVYTFLEKELGSKKITQKEVKKNISLEFSRQSCFGRTGL